MMLEIHVYNKIPTCTCTQCLSSVKKWEIKKFIFQYVFDVELEEDELMVSLEQWDKRIDRELGKENDTIGFFIMKASTHTTLL